MGTRNTVSDRLRPKVVSKMPADASAENNTQCRRNIEKPHKNPPPINIAPPSPSTSMTAVFKVLLLKHDPMPTGGDR